MTPDWPASRLSRVYLLSPAHSGGKRAIALMRAGSTSPLAERLHAGTLTIGEAFAFMSSLYFRGKLAYAQRFAGTGAQEREAYVITPTRGLQPLDTIVSEALLREFAATDIASAGAQFSGPLTRDLAGLIERLTPTGVVVLLGSIATSKYVDVLTAALGPRLHYPPSFIGRGDMSRGGLLLRQAASGEELDYAPLDLTSVRRGPRPPKLAPQPRNARTEGAR